MMIWAKFPYSHFFFDQNCLYAHAFQFVSMPFKLIYLSYDNNTII